jgi:nicotinamidase-related amidase
MPAQVDISDPAHSEAGTAILIVDMISDFTFEDGDKLFEKTLPIAHNVAELKTRAKRHNVPVVYVNDNFGKWQEDFRDQTGRTARSSEFGRKITEILAPEPNDYYVLKPQRSGFYETPLKILLSTMNVRRVIVTGVTTDICVHFTAHDAYMRGFSVAVPADCTAAAQESYKDDALRMIARVAEADISVSTSIDLQLLPQDK